MLSPFFSSHLPKMKNRPDFFGHQYVMNTDDQIVAEEERLLIGATDLSLAECTGEVRRRGGIAVPAHINRGSNGLLVNLGLMPEEPTFPLVETWAELPINEELLRGRGVLNASDAHQLGSIREAVFALDTERFSLGGLWDWLKKFNM